MKFDDLDGTTKALLIHGTISAKALELLSQVTNLSIDFWVNEISDFANYKLRAMPDAAIDALVKQAKRGIDECLLRDEN